MSPGITIYSQREISNRPSFSFPVTAQGVRDPRVVKNWAGPATPRGGKSWLPAIESLRSPDVHKIQSIGVYTTKTEKEQIFRNVFFPPPPDTPNIAPDPQYPQSKWNFSPPTNQQMQQAIRHLKNRKATRTGTIPNDVFKAIRDLAVPYLGPIY
ncbi:hypothetical protein F5050DRAFT_1581918 [Lentinula boryana]|uniref:Uncharacterized protein n=1 Tax=Lentinula boryana TaxID=40481 RepID=A0ABQ8PXH5_9AGAR|nr:hypothetical protein F5050DRAFT_1581918 [Lentinula boryana]